MPKIKRQPQKIFAGQANSDELGAFGTVKYTQTSGGTPVYSNDIETLQSNPAYEQGWSAAVLADKAPFLEEMNGIQYGFSKQIAYLLEMGLPEWDENTTYYTNSFCQVDGVLYQSVTDENIGNNPAEDTTETNWKKVEVGAQWGQITGDIANQADLQEQLTNISQKLSPDYAKSREMELTLNKVQPIEEDGYLFFSKVQRNEFKVDLCDADGNELSALFIALDNTEVIKAKVDVQVAWSGWSPLIKKGSYIQVTSNNDYNTNYDNLLVFYPATRGITNV